MSIKKKTQNKTHLDEMKVPWFGKGDENSESSDDRFETHSSETTSLLAIYVSGKAGLNT